MENIPKKFKIIQNSINDYFVFRIDSEKDEVFSSQLKLELTEHKKILAEIKRLLISAEKYGGVSQIIQALKTKQLNAFEINE